jgi:hypothetical protein
MPPSMTNRFCVKLLKGDTMIERGLYNIQYNHDSKAILGQRNLSEIQRIQLSWNHLSITLSKNKAVSTNQTQRKAQRPFHVTDENDTYACYARDRHQLLSVACD